MIKRTKINLYLFIGDSLDEELSTHFKIHKREQGLRQREMIRYLIFRYNKNKKRRLLVFIKWFARS